MANHPHRKKESVMQDLADAMIEPERVENPPADVERSFSGIREALFDDWDRLRQGKITTDNAKASARMADVILGSVETQIETIKVSKLHGLSPLLVESKKT